MDVVLVHGAWHGAWVWDAVVAELERGGVSVEAVELPFTGFPDDARTARAAIERAGRGTVVCGHSYGGFVVSAAARGLPVGHLVYLCAFMADESEDVMPLWFSRHVPLHDAMLHAQGRTSIDASRAHECFYEDCDPGTSAELVSRLRTMPGPGAPPVDRSDPAWREVPSMYVVCTRDKAIHPEVQRAMARHAGQVLEWDSDHSPFASDPMRVAALLADTVRSARSRAVDD